VANIFYKTEIVIPQYCDIIHPMLLCLRMTEFWEVLLNRWDSNC